MNNTIEDLTISKTFYKRDRDAFGNRTKEPYKKDVKREIQLVSGWTRFGHYLIDAIIIGIILFFLNYFFLYNFKTRIPFGFDLNGYTYNFLPTIDNIVITLLYYFICEKTMQRTIGKFVTNSVVINKYAQSPDSYSLIGRTFARLVPFEALSCISNRGWHDEWSKTYVVNLKERAELRRLLNEKQGFFLSDSTTLLD